MTPKEYRNIAIASVVFSVLALSYMNTAMNSGEWIRSSGNEVGATPFSGLSMPAFQGILSQGLWNKCMSVKKQGPISESFASCSNLQKQDFVNDNSFGKLEGVQTLVVFSAFIILVGTLLIFITLGTEHRGVHIASIVFMALGSALAIAALCVYANYWKRSTMIQQQPVHYVMGWGQAVYIASTIFAVLSTILAGVSLSTQGKKI